MISFTKLEKIVGREGLEGQGTSLVVQWLRHCTSTAEGMGPILGGGTKIPYAQWCNNKKEGKNQDFCLGQAISEMPGGTW